MKTILRFVVVLLLPFQLLSKDAYSIGDTLYVWSGNGLKLREEPGLKARALGILYACDPLVVSEITGNEQAVKLLDIDTASNEKHPYFLKGKWVKVTTLDGRTGYVMDVYLLALPCNNINVAYIYGFENIRSVLPGMTTSTVYFSSDAERRDVINTVNSVEVINTRGANWGGFTITLQGWTIEEAVVFLNFFMKLNNQESDNRINKNWEKEMVISLDGGYCEVFIKDQNTKIVISGTCHC